MTEPVAYLVNGVAFNDIDRAKFYSDVLKYHKKIDIDIESLVPIPLYTSEQLHPRVKMTQTQFDEFNSLYSQGLLFSEAMEMLGTQGESERYVNIRNRIYTQYLRENMDSEVIFAQLWQLYNPNNPEETIEIIPDMNWFVIAKNKYEDCFAFLKNKNLHVLEWIYSRSDKVAPKRAFKFDTKEEAEKWTNPLTEAVQLPVEGE